MKSIFTWLHGKFGVVTTAALVLGILAQGAATGVYAEKNPNNFILPPQSKPYGLPYGEWSNAWWQWALSLPVPRDNPQAHPMFDTTGVNCGVGQSGQVWFLGGGFGTNTFERTCTMPPGKAIFFPILNTERDNAANPTRTIEDMRASAIARQNLSTDLAADLDGEAVTNLANYRISNIDTPNAFGFTLPEQNLFAFFGQPAPAGSCYVPAGWTDCVPYTAVNDGYYLMMRPLAAGEHTLHFSGTLGTFHLNVTYHLNIEP